MEERRKGETHLLSLNRRSLRMELVWDGLTSAEDEEASPLPFCCGSVCGDWPRPMSVGLLGELAESMADRQARPRASILAQKVGASQFVADHKQGERGVEGV